MLRSNKKIIKKRNVPVPSKHSRSFAGMVLVIEALEMVELLGGRATGSPLTAAVCATHAPKVRLCPILESTRLFCAESGDYKPGSIGLTGSVLGIVK